MSKNKTTFVMPGADPVDEADDQPLDLSFMEPTDEEKEAAAAIQAEKDALKAEADEEEAAKAKAKEEEAEALAAEADKDKKPAAEDKKDELSEDEKKLAAQVEADKAKHKKQPMVPKSRLDEVLAKNREITAQLDKERAARAAATPKPAENAVAFDFDAKETEYMQHVIDGEKDKALAVRKEIRAAEREADKVQTREVAGQDSEAMALAEAAAVIEASFPQFVAGHEKHNAEATARVVKMRDALIMSGANAVEALNEAVDFVVKKYGFDEAIDVDAKDDKVVQLDDKRKKDVQKKIDAQKKQPPDVSGEGERTRKEREPTAIESMTDAEFDALPESTRRRLRGDVI